MNSQRKISLALLLGRVPIGLYFLFAGYNKIAGTGVRAFVDGASGAVPAWAGSFGTSYLYALPFAECVFGLLVVLGLLTRTSSLMLSLMLVSFLIAMHDPMFVYNIIGTKPGIPFDRNWLLLSGTLAITLLGPGTLSIDQGIHKRRARAVDKASK